jgi:hypothetical protein
VIEVVNILEDEQYLQEMEEKAEADWEADMYTAYIEGKKAGDRQHKAAERKHQAWIAQYQARDRQQLARIAELERQLADRSSQV